MLSIRWDRSIYVEILHRVGCVDILRRRKWAMGEEGTSNAQTGLPRFIFYGNDDDDDDDDLLLCPFHVQDEIVEAVAVHGVDGLLPVLLAVVVNECEPLAEAGLLVS